MVKARIYFKTLTVTLGNFSCNFSRNFVATQVAPKIAKCIRPRQQIILPFSVTASVAESKIRFYFSQRSRKRFYRLFQHLRSATSSATFLAMLSSISQAESSLLSSPWSSSAVPLHSVTQLFV